MSHTLYAYNGKKEYTVTNISLEDGIFSAHYKDINGTMYWIIDEKIIDYEFYDNYTEIRESFDLKEWLSKNN